MNKITGSRRDFIRASVGLTAGFSVPVIVPNTVFGLNAPSNRINMAVIGVGGKGTGNLKGFLTQPRVQMIALCDVYKPFAVDGKRIVDEKYGNQDCRIYNDYRKLYEKEGLDAVVTALPDHWHGIIGIDAVRKGLHVYGEKPLTRTIEEGRTLCRAVKQHGVVWQTGSQQRSSQLFHKAAELVINGRLGKIIKTEVGLAPGHKGIGPMPLKPVPNGLDWDMWLGPAPWRPYHDFSDGSDDKEKRQLCHYYWRYNRDFAAGQLTNWGAHQIDCAAWGLGLDRTGPVEVEGKAQFPESGFYNSFYKFKFKCTYKNGRVLHVSDAYQGGVKFHGEKGWIYVSRKILQASDSNILREKIGPNEIKLYKSSDHFVNFLECIRSGKETAAPAEIGHRSCSVGLLAEIAMVLGKKIKWDPEKEQVINNPKANRMLGRVYRQPWAI